MKTYDIRVKNLKREIVTMHINAESLLDAQQKCWEAGLHVFKDGKTIKTSSVDSTPLGVDEKKRLDKVTSVMLLVVGLLFFSYLFIFKDYSDQDNLVVQTGNIALENTELKERVTTKVLDKGFSSFHAEAETAKNELECPNSVDSDITPALYDGAGALYGCILGSAQTVKWFINEIPNSNRVRNIKFLWNDWFIDKGYGSVHADIQEALKALEVLIKLYAPKKSVELNNIFFENNDRIIISDKFILNYTYDHGPAIDERMIVITEK